MTISNTSTDNSNKGLIFNIQKFSLQDGPGIRTTVFMKGCPLKCRWCSNPESIKMFPEIMFFTDKCVKCGSCQKVCSREAIIQIDDTKRIDRDKCNLCMDCVKVCPSDALQQVGRYISVEDVVNEVKKDALFYVNSGGGMTISGGEPLLQWGFIKEVFRACKEQGICTALDTTGHIIWHIIDEVLEYIDLALYDIKHMDAKMHKNGTGVTNELILANLPRVARKVKTWIRVPVIPGYNDSESNMVALAHLASDLRVEKISLLPYHSWGEKKYDRLGLNYMLKDTEPLQEEKMQQLKKILESYGTPVTIGK